MVALHQIAAQLQQEIALLAQLDPFGDHFLLQAGGNGDDGADDGDIIGIGRQFADKGLVDLDPVEGQPLQVAEAGVSYNFV